MKNRPILIILALLAFTLSGCAVNSPVAGAFFTNVKSPQGDKVKLTAKSFSKQGKSQCASYVMVVATGDCSVEEAMKNGSITEVHHVDQQSFSVWFFYQRYETHVYGE